MEADYILNGLVQRGMSPEIAQAFVWNFMDESGLNPGINEAAPIVPGSRGGFGLSQWTGPRRRALEAFAAERGVDVSDPDMQMDFLMYELAGPESAAWGKISGAGSTPEAASLIVNHFLRPAEEHRARREAKYLGGKMPVVQPGQSNALAAPAMQPPPQNALTAQKPEFQMQANYLDPSAFMRSGQRQFIPI